MTKNNKLKEIDTHFEFGQNWSEYSNLIDQERINNAEKSLGTLIDSKFIKGKSFLDIGCGSGLSALAALNMGASTVMCTDIDPKSVHTTKRTLERFSKNPSFESKVLSVFDLSPDTLGVFDVVYSWGVLHHTGSMYEAIEAASKIIANEGVFVIALYRKTPFCKMWKIIKRLYNSSPRFIQKVALYFYATLIIITKTLCGTNVISHIKNYKENRGMSFLHDIHDWLGGYPYESISPTECHGFLEKIGFKLISQNIYVPQTIFKTFIQIMGSGCDEYVFKKIG